MTPIPSNGFYNRMLYSLQNNDSQILSALNNRMVKTKVIEYINTNSKRLDLTNIELHLLPDDIFNLSMFRDHLYALSLDKNVLKNIPESIGNLLALNYLSFSQNQLTSLPESIGNLSTLSNLHLSLNQLTSLPESIGRLSALNSLNLFRNQLTSLPESIGRLSALNHLHISRNQLTTLPESIGNLSTLNHLDLSQNLLTTLPKSIGTLPALKKLNLSWNQLISLPESIGNLRQLRVLNLSYNWNLSSLPREILNLSTNCIVDISGCNFSQATLDRLQESISRPGYTGPRISHAMINNNLNQNIEMPTIEESLQHLYTIINKAPSELLKLNRTETLRIWLYKLCYTADYRQSQKECITKIISYFEKANADEGFRNIFFATIDDAVGTCGDRVALSVLQLGINYQLETIDLNNIQKLAQFLIKGVWALEILYEIAREKVKCLPFFDEIEVYLGYPIKLKEQLDLPIDVNNMLYFSCSSLTSSDLETAKEIVLATINDQNELPNFLISQSKWIESLKHNYKEEYLSIIHTRDNNNDDPDYMKINNTYKKELKSLTMKALDWK